MSIENRGVELTHYSVSGFRSLTDFSIGLNRGLNVLVGPNGSGKTNFIEFLDFLSSAISQSAATAVSQAGGVARVFSQEQSKSKTSKISAIISGVADMEGRVDDKELKIFNFEYEIEIKFSRSQSVIFVSKETIKFRKLRQAHELELCRSPVGAISVRRQVGTLDKGPVFEVSPRLQTKNIRNPLRYLNRFGMAFRAPDEKNLDSIYVGFDESIFSARQNHPAVDAVRSAITRGRSFNLVPEHVRVPDDLTRTPAIYPDGSGLTATLYHLQRASQPTRRSRPVISRRFLPEHLEAIVEWTKLVFPELNGVSVVADPHTGKYLGYLNIGQESLKIPLQSASDGTLKWLGLVTLIITRGGIYSVEEPENFLHPKMQQYLIDLIRDFSSEPGRPGYFIMSSHSETIINKCHPDELILFDFVNGKTQCSRLENQEAVLEQINETGFGLGYYYANNAVS
ncbi:AAA family ATPase [Roseomonas haemaphysalidis]|uniref:AAA family ATPase n=2 Tax=Roseomonas haemaphysalidis TaxID=2768162 RepID=A0ABS3KS22_9PROT|nr:AAA family ATPase [Roseomonas haemaphysalidis]MBO1079832.1 AAA family ATPase [Roseomonas haemaphysalidis]